MKKAFGISLFVAGVLVGLFVRLQAGVVIAFIGALIISPKLVANLTERRPKKSA